MYGAQFESDVPLGDEELLTVLVDMAERYPRATSGSTTSATG